MELNGFNQELLSQYETLEKILQRNKVVYQIIEQSTTLGIEHYYIGGGCITQTVWNYLSGNDLMYGINDVDFVYLYWLKSS